MVAKLVYTKRIFKPEAAEETVFLLEDGLIKALYKEDEVPAALEKQAQTLDLRQLLAIPGMIDLQMNGAPFCDFWQDLSPDDVKKLRLEQALRGVTSFLPTLITDSLPSLIKHRDFLKKQGAGKAIDNAKIDQAERGLARMPGIHLEGPYLSPFKPGVHPPEWVRPIETALQEGSLATLIDDSIKMVTAALEGDPDGSFQSFLQARGVAVSLGHTNATFAEANRSFDRGARLLTHAFNAMAPLLHRKPGAIGAALLDKRVSTCLIADGLHVLPPICQLIFELKGSDRLILVSDRAAIGTSQGELVGSSISLDDALRNMIDWGICNLGEAAMMASTNAARAISLSGLIGTLAPGFHADIAFLDDQLQTVETMIGGYLSSEYKQN